MSQEALAPAAENLHLRSRGATRSLSAFLVASVAVHAAVVVGLPDWLRNRAASKPVVLEVRILPPAPLPMAASRPDPALQPAADREKPSGKAAPQPERSQTAAAPASSGPDPVVEGSFAVAPPTLPGPPPAPDPKTLVASLPVTPPSFNAAYLSNPSPAYPPAARRAGQQGTVTLRVLVRRDGLPWRVEIEKSSGSSHLDTAAVDAVWSWRFVPARQGPDPIESWVLVPVVFRLEGPS